MSRKPDDKPEAEHSASSKAPNQAYDVGYGKPPVATRFAKGRSGNPRGRPPKPKAPALHLSDAPSDMFLAGEAYRPVTVRENGKTFQLPLSQAILRAMSMAALKGNRLSQQYLLEQVAAAEEKHSQYKVQNYVRLASLKSQHEQIFTEHKRRKLPPPELLPHPDDIVLKPATGDAFVNGPETPEEAGHCAENVALRDHLLLRAAHAEKTGKGPKVQDGENMYCMYLLYACLLDQCLPRRLRWQDGDAPSCMHGHMGLPRREREQRMAAEFASLKETRLEPLYVTREMEQQIKRSTDRWLKRSQRHSFSG